MCTDQRNHAEAALPADVLHENWQFYRELYDKHVEPDSICNIEISKIIHLCKIYKNQHLFV